MTRFAGKSADPAYQSDWHFYRDIPLEVPGGDPVDPNILKKGDIPGISLR